MLNSSLAFFLRSYMEFRTSSSTEKSSILLVAMKLSHCLLLMLAAFFSPSRNVVRAKMGVGKSFKKLLVVWLHLDSDLHLLV